MKLFKNIMPLFLILVYLGTAGYMFYSRTETDRNYKALVEEADSYAELGDLTDAVLIYEQALSLKPNIDLELKVGELYLDYEEYARGDAWYSGRLEKDYPYDGRAYEYGIKVALLQNNVKKAFKNYARYQSFGVEDENVELLIDEIRYTYNLSGQYESVAPFSSATNTAAVQVDDLWGFVSLDGNAVIRNKYTEVSGFTAKYAVAADSNGKQCYIDAEDNIRITPEFITRKDPDFGAVQKFKPIQSNLVLAYNGTVWNYYSADTFEKMFGGYTDAYPITNGVGAVCSAEQKWALISVNGELITDFIFDDVVADEKGVICRNNAVIVCADKQYYLVDLSGKKIGDTVFADAKAFNENSYAAVKKGDHWCFVDENGVEVDLGDYDDVQSFSSGYAAVKSGSQWGYIDTTGKVVIAFAFDDAKPFYMGNAFVKSGGKWALLKLVKDNY